MATSGSILREARLRAGLTQIELGERTGKDRAQIARWERDAVSPPYETLQELVRACGFDLSAELILPDTTADEVIAVTGSLTPQERIHRMLERRAAPVGP